MDSQPDGSGTVKLAVVDILDRDDKARTTVPVWQWPALWSKGAIEGRMYVSRAKAEAVTALR